MTPLRPSLHPYPVHPLHDLLLRTAARLPDKIALIDGDRSFTYRDLADASARFAAALAALGVRPAGAPGPASLGGAGDASSGAGEHDPRRPSGVLPRWGDRVAILAPNCAEFEIAFYGILRAGAVATTLNSGYREREIAHQLSSSGASVLIVHHSLLSVIPAKAGIQSVPTPSRAIYPAPITAALPALRHIIVIAASDTEPGSLAEGLPEALAATNLTEHPGAPSELSFWDLIEHASPTPPSLTLDPRRDLAALPYSSGTTGLNKGVMLTHYNLACNVRQFTHRGDDSGAPTEREVFLVHLPLFHIYALNVIMNVSISLGATQILMGRFDPGLLLDLLTRHRVTSLYTAPPVILALSQHPRLTRHRETAAGGCGNLVGRAAEETVPPPVGARFKRDQPPLPSLRMICSGAAPLSADLQQRVSAALGVPIVQGYGLTETSPVTHIDFTDAARARPGTVGPPLPDTEQRVVDLDTGTRDLPPGEAGELLLRGPHVTPGYFNDPAATAATLDTDGWLHTGDIVSADADGYLRILDRKKELIKYKGFQVPPAELEGLLLEHPAVADASVIGIPDPEAGEVPQACVVLRPGVPPTPATAEALTDYIAARVATFKRIRAIEFLDAIPKNPSGKILRRVLVERERGRGG